MKSRTYHGWTIRPACSTHQGIFVAAVRMTAQAVTPDSPMRRFTFVGLGNFADAQHAERSAIQWARAWIDTHDSKSVFVAGDFAESNVKDRL